MLTITGVWAHPAVSLGLPVIPMTAQYSGEDANATGGLMFARSHGTSERDKGNLRLPSHSPVFWLCAQKDIGSSRCPFFAMRSKSFRIWTTVL